MGGIAFLLKDWIIIISTSIVGSFLISFGVVVMLHPEIMKIDL